MLPPDRGWRLAEEIIGHPHRGCAYMLYQSCVKRVTKRKRNVLQYIDTYHSETKTICFHLSIVCRDRTHVGCVTHDTARITNGTKGKACTRTQYAQRLACNYRAAAGAAGFAAARLISRSSSAAAPSLSAIPYMIKHR